MELPHVRSLYHVKFHEQSKPKFSQWLDISRALLLYLESLDRMTVPNFLTKSYRDFI
jgi:aromatic ring-cleaving dioxygenase